MDSYDLVHNIKAQKANALARYKMFTNITKAVQFIEAFIAVTIISWSSTRLPFVVKFSTEYLIAFTSYLMNQHVVFLVGNVIVFMCYILSRFTDSGNESNLVSGIPCNESCNDQLTRPKTIANPPNPKPKQLPLQVIETPPKTRIVMIPKEKAIIKTETLTVTKPEVQAVTAIKQATKQIERFQRTQSDLKSKISMKNNPELRRSVTERRRKTVASGEIESMVKSIQAVDKLSDEEFRIAVETFISKQQRFLKQQSMVAVGS